jgi:NADH-quinone oxidoreductase subunit N
MNLAPILPELILTIGSIVLMMVAAFMGRRGSALCSWASVALLLGAAVALIGEPQNAGAIFGGQLAADGFGAFGKLIIYLCAAVAIVMAHNWFERDFEHSAEYPVLILLSAVGMSVMVSATSLVTLYVGLELQSLSAYVLASTGAPTSARPERAQIFRPRRACLRASCSTEFPALSASPARSSSTASRRISRATARQSIGLLFGWSSLLAGLAFKVSAGAVPHVDSRRLRRRTDAGHRILRLCAASGAAVLLGVRSASMRLGPAMDAGGRS